MSKFFADAVEAELGDLRRIALERPISENALTNAKNLIDKKINTSPQSQAGIFARYLRARSYEEGILSAQNIDAALADYSFIMNYGGELRSEGMVGRARLLHWKDERANAAEAIALCVGAVNFDSNVRAMMFLGYIYEHTMLDLKLAAEWYLRAFRNNLPWGLRYYASVQFKRKKFVTSMISHVIATIVSPFMVARYGKRDPFRL